jgi:hypothetical protein
MEVWLGAGAILVLLFGLMLEETRGHRLLARLVNRIRRARARPSNPDR